jgi:hypothetical protein
MKLAIQFLQPIMFINEKRKIRNGKNVIVCSRELAPKESKFRCCWTHAILKTNLTDEQADFTDTSCDTFSGPGPLNLMITILNP